jgi:5-formyltetrahydrofolate cyclo-ligase
MIHLTKAELRRLYTPLGDNGEAAEKLVAFWERDWHPGNVFCYISKTGECRTMPILCFCLRNGIPLAVPLCEPGGVMTARRIYSFSQLRPGRFGLMEPPPHAELMEAPNTMIVPGRVYDRKGFRIGHGGGYYDRYLAGRQCKIIGLCQSDRILNSLPHDEWDISVDIIATERGLTECRK